SPKYPNLNDINYLICLANIDNKDIPLDASNINHPFGIVPAICYNGYSRIVNSKNGTAYILDADSLIDKNQTVVNIKPTDNPNQLELNINHRYGIYSSLKFRNKRRNNAHTWKDEWENTLTANQGERKMEDVTI